MDDIGHWDDDEENVGACCPVCLHFWEDCECAMSRNVEEEIEDGDEKDDGKWKDCPNPTCTRQCKADLFSCPRCWLLLPKGMRYKIKKFQNKGTLTGAALIHRMIKALDVWKEHDEGFRGK